MQFTTFSTLLALSAFPLSTLAQPYNPWELPRLGTHASSGRPGNDPNSTITFTWNDPNTATSASCFASFLPSFGNEMSHPVDYMDCAPSAETKDSFFAFKIDRYMSIGDFSLTLKRGFRDPSVGTPDFVTAYGSLTVTRSDKFVCIYGASGVGNCDIEGGMPILVPITSLIA